MIEQHAQLRRDLVRLDRLAHSAQVRPVELDALRTEAEALLERLHEHMRWEESSLLPVLRRTGAWGKEQAERLLDEHGEQRELLDIVIELLWDGKRSAALVSRDIIRLVALLDADMAAEEALLEERTFARTA